jgi:hypothetical protein
MLSNIVNAILYNYNQMKRINSAVENIIYYLDIEDSDKKIILSSYLPA